VGATARRSHPRAHSRVVDVIDDLKALFEKDQPLLATTGRAPLQHVFCMLSSRLRASCRCLYDPTSHPRLALLRATTRPGVGRLRDSETRVAHLVPPQPCGWPSRWAGWFATAAGVGGRACSVRARASRAMH
jgi:hypothetical protein